MRAWIAQALHAAEVARWRLSKALGVGGLERISWGCLGFAALALVCLAWAAVEALGVVRAPSPAPAGAPVRALINIWVQLAIMVISALISYAMRPKPETPKSATPQAPVAEDGKGIVEIFGTVWVDDANQLAWRAGTPMAIRRKGGKK